MFFETGDICGRGKDPLFGVGGDGPHAPGSGPHFEARGVCPVLVLFGPACAKDVLHDPVCMEGDALPPAASRLTYKGFVMSRVWTWHLPPGLAALRGHVITGDGSQVPSHRVNLGVRLRGESLPAGRSGLTCRLSVGGKQSETGCVRSVVCRSQISGSER